MSNVMFTNEEICSIIDIKINSYKDWNNDVEIELKKYKEELETAQFDILKKYFIERIERCEQRIHDNTVAIEALESLKSCILI